MGAVQGDPQRWDLGLPWLREARQQGQQHAGHALLIHGPEGVGQWELALGLAMDRLCEQAHPQGPSPATAGTVRPLASHCGQCPACKLVMAHAHPDLRVLMPEAVAAELDWGSEAGEGASEASNVRGGDRASKAKPSREIKVEAVRGAVAFTQSTSARGRGKVLLVFPAESMNAISANTLLKTLEEPPGECWFVLACAEAQHLLPTVRSRCQALALRTPERAEAVQWLRAQGVHGADVLLAASAGQPQVALRWAHSGLSAAQWLGLPAQVRRAEVGEMASWGFARALDAMSKLCHDSLCVAAGAEPRFFPSEVWGRGVGGQGGLPVAEVPVLLSWQRELQSQWRHADHPWAMPLAVEALVQSASQALR